MPDRRGRICDGHFGGVSPPKPDRLLAERIGAAQHRFDADEIFKRDRRAEQGVRRIVGRQIEQRGNPERLAGVADQGLFDRRVILRTLEPRHGPDRRKTDRRIEGVQVLFKSGETACRQIGVENLVADPVERVEPPEPFLGVLLAACPGSVLS